MAEGRRRKAVGRKQKAGSRRRAACCLLPAAFRSASGWTLIELVITMTVMAILSVGVIPLVKTAVKRQREYELREDLRQMREAIKEFHRDTVGMPNNPLGNPTGLTSTTPAPNPQ